MHLAAAPGGSDHTSGNTLLQRGTPMRSPSDVLASSQPVSGYELSRIHRLAMVRASKHLGDT